VLANLLGVYYEPLWMKVVALDELEIALDPGG